VDVKVEGRKELQTAGVGTVVVEDDAAAVVDMRMFAAAVVVVVAGCKRCHSVDTVVVAE
jgi:hypothetical protein